MRRRGQIRLATDGVLVVDKPAGPTSHDVVEALRRRFRPGKLGHAGTLDPFATGVLVLAFNQATRLMELLGTGEKVYQATLALGRATDTGDPTGQTVAEAPAPQVSPEQAEQALRALEGRRQQAPPSYSAAKHQGKPLYAYARAGQEVSKPPRPITVYEARLVGMVPGGLEFLVRCSRGTYVRALGEDLAGLLGSVGHLAALRRLKSAPFALETAVALDEALDWTDQELAARLLGPSEALELCGVPAVSLDEDRVWELRRGRILTRETLLGPGAGAQAEGPFRVLSSQGELVAVLRWLGPGEKRPGRDYDTIRVFPEPSSLDGSVVEASASALGAE